ncbi:3'(2'),5'-bisphosphate nucleotidase CysQ, partial [Pseudomonas sp. GW460-12-1-14-LB3]
GCDFALKDDQSPVTEADHAAEAIILAALRRATPDIPVVAEEEISGGHVPGDLGARFYLVDPLDGTREFVSRNGDFTVNIALIENAAPV